MKLHFLVSAAIVALATSMTVGAQASVIPMLDNVTADGSNFLYSYGAILAPDQGIKAGDEFVLIDFQGYLAGSVNSMLPDWTASISNTLPVGLVMTPGFTDSNLIPDLVFTYEGPNFDVAGGPFPADVVFSGFSAVSSFDGTAAGAYTAIGVKNTGTQTGTTTFNEGTVSMPSPVPEPAVWAMMLTGFFGAGFMMRGRRKTFGVAAQS
jgi:hypothetical protein